ncbi:uncharacterized protein LOC135128328 [Zophobas morio]|uniref:uncharacterized protein LOC135128328 n=1 Tax=Zophobas morio TaxID=2755281 RepID=UPI00308324A9
MESRPLDGLGGLDHVSLNVTDEIVDTVIVSTPTAPIPTSTIGPNVATPVISRPAMWAPFPWGVATSATGAVPCQASRCPVMTRRHVGTYSYRPVVPLDKPTAEEKPLVPRPVPILPCLSRQSVQSCYAHPRDTRRDGVDLVRKSRTQDVSGAFFRRTRCSACCRKCSRIRRWNGTETTELSGTPGMTSSKSSPEPCGCLQVPPSRPQLLSNVGDVEKLRNR